MSITTAYSSKELPYAVSDLKESCGDRDPRVVIFFASARYTPAEVSRQMQAAFPAACVAGCSTAGEIAAGKMMSGSIAAMFLDDEIVGDADAAVVENLRDGVRVSGAFSQIEEHFGAPLSSLDINRYVGLVLVDGLSCAEEGLMESIGDRTDIFFVGGSAGDDLKFQSTHVLVNGRDYTNAALLLLLELKKGFDIIKTQSFVPAGKILVATKVDEPHRSVIEFDHEPALEAYAEALGVTPEEAPAFFARHPLGLMVDGDPFVRSPRLVESHAIRFYCQIKQGMELAMLQATDIVADTKKAIEVRKDTGEPISGIIDFQCILRTLQLRGENRCDQYGAIFAGIPVAGFSTYGEAYLGHMNQTSTMLVFH
ncbi:MAG TPA: FIST N-terminal domain-containing protein [Bryobacteraceae bacterium]|jgi:hypothetical protein|nr:FIST N-terminal domain-containing protein [Bryobacteraceae bacterium]